MPAEPEILVEVDGAIATLTLNRPDRRNSIGRHFSGQMQRALTDIERNAAVRVVIVTGAGSAFSAGGDIFEIMNPEDSDLETKYELIRGYNQIVKRIFYSPTPFIAAVNGPAVGGGAALALACDIAVGCPEARYDFAFAKLGLAAADMGTTWLLREAIGPMRANRYLLTAGSIWAAEGLALGLFADVVPNGTLLARAAAIAGEIAALPAPAIRATKASLRRGGTLSLDSDLEFEAYIQSFAFQTKDHKNRVRDYTRGAKRKLK